MAFRISALCLSVVLAACSSTGGKKDSPVFAQHSSPVARARLQARIDNIKYQRGVTLVTNLERISAHGEMAVQPCVEGLESPDAMTRMGCAYVLGRIGDTRTVEPLERLLQDDVPFVRFEAASALGAMGSRAGYAALVRGLGNNRIEFRYKCIEALQEFTHETFGFRHDASPEERAGAVRRWQDWLERFEAEEL
ncbi:MAG: HEAT repeat domain-containing protein [Planctomycetota bacterium]